MMEPVAAPTASPITGAIADGVCGAFPVPLGLGVGLFSSETDPGVSIGFGAGAIGALAPDGGGVKGEPNF